MRPPPPDRRTGARPAPAPRRVLLVLDQPAVAELVKLTLGHGRFETRQAVSAAEALVVLGRWRPDLARRRRGQRRRIGGGPVADSTRVIPPLHGETGPSASGARASRRADEPAAEDPLDLGSSGPGQHDSSDDQRRAAGLERGECAPGPRRSSARRSGCAVTVV